MLTIFQLSLFHHLIRTLVQRIIQQPDKYLTSLMWLHSVLPAEDTDSDGSLSYIQYVCSFSKCSVLYLSKLNKYCLTSQEKALFFFLVEHSSEFSGIKHSLSLFLSIHILKWLFLLWIFCSMTKTPLLENPQWDFPLKCKGLVFPGTDDPELSSLLLACCIANSTL